MALLAEQKRKVNFGLDPQNTSWSNDSSKFGQRLMEKMGWEKGKGLGANEDGMTEHVKAGYKSDSRGLGCTPQAADAWIAHQDDFNDLLKALNSQSEAGGQKDKTEQTKHVDGRKRYYGRFARGQVQTLRSTDDLDCIFGKRKRKSKTAERDEQPVTKPDCDDEEEKRHGLTTTTSTSSVQEYFAKKMAEMKAKKEANTRESNSAEADIGETSQERRGGDKKKKKKSSVFGTVSFSYNEVKEGSSPAGEQASRGWYQDFLEDSSSKINLEVKEKSSKKKKRKKMKGDDADDCDVEMKSDGKKRKTKKDCKEKAQDDSVPILNLHAVLETSELPSTCKVEGNKRSKKRKIKENETVAVASSTCDNTGAANFNEGNEDEKRKKKKKRKTCNKDEVVDNSFNKCALGTKGVNDIKQRTVDASSLECSSKGSLIHNEVDVDRGQEKENSGPVETSESAHKKKNKKKRKLSEINIDEEIMSVENQHNDAAAAVKSKKKKKKKNSCTNESDKKGTEDISDVQTNENPAAAEHVSNISNAGNQNIADVTQTLKERDAKSKEKRKKKKKKKKVKDQCSKSNAFFPGSNIADIVGYGYK